MENILTRYYENCEKLEVNLTNSFQSECVFIGIDLEIKNVVYVSESYYNLFSYEIYNKNIDIIFSQSSLQKILSYSNKFKFDNKKSRVFVNLEINLKNFLINIPSFMFFSGSILCIEFQSNFDRLNYNFDEVYYQEMLNYIIDSKDNINILSNNICKYISEITGFERTYFCDFLQDGHGFVRANYYSNGLESLLHQHFPSTDLPMSVRNLYIKNKFRLICNVDYTQIPIKGCEKKIDLTYSIFRDISQYHLDYLKNMGLKSAASFSIINDGKLKGLIGCHSKSKNYTPIEILPKIQVLIDAFSKKIDEFKSNITKKIQLEYNLSFKEFIFSYEESRCNFDKMSQKSFDLLKDIFKSHLMFYVLNDKVQKNTTIPIDFINEILYQLKKTQIKNVYLLDKLISISPIFEKWSKNVGAGILVINLSNDFSTFIALIRKEESQTIKWNGSPSDLELLDEEILLNPKRSFNTWLQDISHKCMPWTRNDYEIASQLHSRIILSRSNLLNNFYKYNENII